MGDTNALKVEMGKTKVALFNCFVEMGKTKVALFNFLLLCNKNILDDCVYLCYLKGKMWQYTKVADYNLALYFVVFFKIMWISFMRFADEST